VLVLVLVLVTGLELVLVPVVDGGTRVRSATFNEHLHEPDVAHQNEDVHELESDDTTN